MKVTPQYWSGQPFPSPGDLPNTRIEPRFPSLQADSLSAEPQRNPKFRGAHKGMEHRQGLIQSSHIYFDKLICLQIGLPQQPVDKESACNAGDPSSIPVLGRSPGERIGYPCQYSWDSLIQELNCGLLHYKWVLHQLSYQGRILWGSAGKKSTCSTGRPGFDPWVRKIPWRQYSDLENSKY